MWYRTQQQNLHGYKPQDMSSFPKITNKPEKSTSTNYTRTTSLPSTKSEIPTPFKSYPLRNLDKNLKLPQNSSKKPWHKSTYYSHVTYPQSTTKQQEPIYIPPTNTNNQVDPRVQDLCIQLRNQQTCTSDTTTKSKEVQLSI